MASSIRFFFVNRYDFFSSGNFKMKNRSADDVSLSEIGKFRLLLLFQLPLKIPGRKKIALIYNPEVRPRIAAPRGILTGFFIIFAHLKKSRRFQCNKK